MGRFSRLGNDLYRGDRSIDFVGRQLLWYSISGLIIVVAVLGLTFKGLNYSIEFKGGAQYQVTLPSSQVTQDEADKLRTAVAGTGIEAAAQPVVTTAGSKSIIVETEHVTDAESGQISAVILKTTGANEQALSESEIGASWGSDVTHSAVTGLVVFLFLVVLFIWAYFREWKMSVAAIVALIHDLLITVGVYALSGFQVSPATVTGVLTILGFSLYDTVVVFDKIRENTKNLRGSRMTYRQAANLAVNQTLVRSINTSLVALIPVAAILYVGAVQLGASTLKDLALALFVGMAAGAYSSIFIATPLLVDLKKNETEVVLAERRARARQRRDGDRYANVPAVMGDIHDDPDGPVSPGRVVLADRDEDDDLDDEPTTGGGSTPGSRPVPTPTPWAAGGLRPRPTARCARARRPAGCSRPGSRAPSAASPRPDGSVEVTATAAAAGHDAIARLVVDVPDFPEPGVVFKDITPLLADHAGFAAVVRGLAVAGREPDATVKVDKVVGMEARGFILAAPVALELGAGFVPVRKHGKLPREVHAVSYALEYGEATLEIHRDAVAPGDRVLLVDDVLATGGTIAATRELVEACGATVVGVAVLMELSFLPGRETIGDLPLHCLFTV